MALGVAHVKRTLASPPTTPPATPATHEHNHQTHRRRVHRPVGRRAPDPSADRHREQIKAGIAERSPLAGLLGLGVLAAFASNYHSVGVGSYTSIQGQTVSVGLLGMVFVIDNHKDF
jgi:hypothetical protein